MRYFKKCREKIIWRFLFISVVTFAVMLSAGTAEATLVVIANSASPINILSKHQLTSLYLGKPASLNGKVIPYNLPDNTQAYQEFYQTMLGWEPSQVSAYWSSQIFSGDSAMQPAAMNDAAEAITCVKESPSAIAYVDSADLKNIHSGVKVIYGDYTIQPYRSPSSESAPMTLYSSGTRGYVTALSTNNPDPDGANSFSGNLSNQDPPGQGQVPSDPSVSQSNLAAQLTTINSRQTGGDLWSLIAHNMTLNHDENKPSVRHWIVWFQQHPRVLDTMVDNAAPYLYYIYKQTQRRHMPAEFSLLPMIESGFNPYAYSYAGASGLWQMMPDTASSYGLTIDWWYDSRRDILRSTNVALDFLVQLQRSVSSWELAAAAYNVGPGALKSAIDRNKSEGQPFDFWSLRLPDQTRQYVPKLLALSALIANPSHYGIKLPFIPDRPFFASVVLRSQMDLQVISQLSGVTLPVLRALNPGLRRFATAPEGQFDLLLPVMSVNTFIENYNKMGGKTQTSWQYHEVRSSEDLNKIARNYHTTVSLLEKINGLSSDQVRAGVGILVPVSLNKTYTALGNISGKAPVMETHSDQAMLLAALKRAAQSQKKALPQEVTGKPIRNSDNLKSLVGKLYGSG